jgi:hypothetical protein
MIKLTWVVGCAVQGGDPHLQGAQLTLADTGCWYATAQQLSSNRRMLHT